MTLSAGDRLGPFVLLSRLGMGGMAQVWAAEQDGHRVALKLLLPQFSRDEAFRRMLSDEVRILRRIRHRNIIRVYGLHDIDGRLVQALELVDGMSLQTLLVERQESLPVEVAAYVAHQAAEGLAFARSVDVELVHRDVAPANIMVGRDGSVRVLDFGIARARDRATSTAAGVIKGRLEYMAPEQAAGAALSDRVDVFALGVVLWEMLAGRRLYRGDGTVETALRRRPAPRLAAPDPLADLVARMLSFPVEHRPSMGEVAGELARSLSGDLESPRLALAQLLAAARPRPATRVESRTTGDVTQADSGSHPSGPTTAPNPILQFDPFSSEADAELPTRLAPVPSERPPFQHPSNGRTVRTDDEGPPAPPGPSPLRPRPGPQPATVDSRPRVERSTGVAEEIRGLRRGLNLALALVVLQSALIAVLLWWR
jgi:serine/threonine protein kinase